MRKTSTRALAPSGTIQTTTALALVFLMVAATIAAGGAPTAAPNPTVAWTNERPGDGTSPRALATVTGDNLEGFAVAFSSRVDLYGPDGAIIWSAVGLPTHGNTITTGDMTGDGTDDVLVASAGFTPPAMLTALDGKEGTVLWSVETGGAQVNEILLTGTGPDAIVVIAAMPGLAEGRVEGYRAGTGEPLWSQDAGDAVTALTTSDLVTVAGTQGGRLHYYETNTGTELHALALPAAGFIRDLVPVYGTVAGVTMVAVGDHAAVGLTGAAAADILHAPVREAWTYDSGARFWSGVASPATSPAGGTTVFLNAWNGAQVHALDSETGTAIWSAGDSGFRGSLPFLSPRSIILADLGDGTTGVVAAGATSPLRAFDAATGALLWESPTPGPTDWLAAIGSGATARIAMTQSYWFVGALDAKGASAWYHDLSPYQAGTVHDMNGDGTTDAVVTTAGHASVVDGTTGETTWRAATWPHLSDAVTTNVAVADLTLDGVPDVIASARTSRMAGVVAAFDGASANLLWKAHADYIVGGITGQLIVEDLDGNGVPDVVFGSNRGHPSHVIAVSGVDGAELWRYHVQDDVIDLVFVDSLEGPRVVALHDHTSCSCFVHPGLVALDSADGTVRWTRDVTDNFASDLAVSRAHDTGTERIVVRDADDPPDDGGVPLAGDGPRFAYLDPATGTETGRVLLTPLGVPTLDAGSFFATADIDGDGLDDIVFTLREPRGRDAQTQVVVLSGQDDGVLWSSDFKEGTANILAEGPPAGGGGTDVLASWSGGAIARLDAEDGTTSWQHTALGAPVWFLAAGRDPLGRDVVFAPQGVLLQGLVDP